MATVKRKACKRLPEEADVPQVAYDDFRGDCELCRHWGLSRRTGAKQNCAEGVEERRGRSRFFAGAKQNGAGAKQNGGGEEEGVSWGSAYHVAPDSVTIGNGLCKKLWLTLGFLLVVGNAILVSYFAAQVITLSAEVANLTSRGRMAELLRAELEQMGVSAGPPGPPGPPGLMGPIGPPGQKGTSMCPKVSKHPQASRPAGLNEGYTKFCETCYKAFSTLANFGESALHCRVDGGTLAMPRDAATNAFLVSLKNAIDEKSNFWFGLHDRRKEGSFEWIDGTGLESYNYWAPGEPNNNGFDENCAHYFTSTGRDSDVNKRKAKLSPRKFNIIKVQEATDEFGVVLVGGNGLVDTDQVAEVVAKKIFGHINGTGEVTPPKEPGRSSVAAKGREPRGSSREGGRHPPSVDPGQGRPPDSGLTLPADPGAKWLRLEAETPLLQAPLHEVARMDEERSPRFARKEQQDNLFELLDCLVVICSPEISTDEIANLSFISKRIMKSDTPEANVMETYGIFDLSQFLSWIGKVPAAQLRAVTTSRKDLDSQPMEHIQGYLPTGERLLPPRILVSGYAANGRADETTMCCDQRFLNVFTKDSPFTLDKLVDVTRFVEPNTFQTKCDDKTGWMSIPLVAYALQSHLPPVTSDTERVSDIRQSPAWAAAMEQMQDRRCFVFGLNTDGVNPDRILPCHNTTHIRTGKQSNQLVVPLLRTTRCSHPFDSSIAITSACVVTFRTLRGGHDRRETTTRHTEQPSIYHTTPPATEMMSGIDAREAFFGGRTNAACSTRPLGAGEPSPWAIATVHGPDLDASPDPDTSTRNQDCACGVKLCQPDVSDEYDSPQPAERRQILALKVNFTSVWRRWLNQAVSEANQAKGREFAQAGLAANATVSSRTSFGRTKQHAGWTHTAEYFRKSGGSNKVL
ncbi:hypothetical protein Bbelb_192790 [Branchiostoma belcheri]|nr:hypothetical protein Bbelb_192790 [Branchiostoma belcheri]